MLFYKSLAQFFFDLQHGKNSLRKNSETQIQELSKKNYETVPNLFFSNYSESFKEKIENNI